MQGAVFPCVTGVAAVLRLGIVEETEKVANRNFTGMAEERIAAIVASFGGHQTGWFELRHDDFQKPQRNGLRFGNGGQLDLSVLELLAQFVDGPQGVFMFLGDQHATALRAL